MKSKENEGEKYRRMLSDDSSTSGFTVALWITGVIAGAYALTMILLVFCGQIETAGQFGDSFGFITALVTGLSFLAVVRALRLQSLEIQAILKDLEHQREHRVNQVSWETEPTFSMNRGLSYHDVEPESLGVVLTNMGSTVSNVVVTSVGNGDYLASVGRLRDGLLESNKTLHVYLRPRGGWEGISLDASWDIDVDHAKSTDRMLTTAPRSLHFAVVCCPEIVLRIQYQTLDYEVRNQTLRVLVDPPGLELLGRERVPANQGAQPARR